MAEALQADFHGQPCWYELTSADPGAAKGFYGAVLGWTWAEVAVPGMVYHLASAGATQVAGMMAAAPEQPSGWSVYIAVKACDATVAQAEALGAKVIVQPADIPGTGRFAILCDPWGAGFGILQPLPGGTGGAFDQTKAGHGNWHEVIVPNPVAALAFYGALFGWVETRAVPMGPQMTYHVFACAGVDIGGACALPGTAPHWKPYFGVGSAKAAAAAVTEAGGRVVHGPDEVPGGAYTLQIADAQGLTLALVGPA